MESKEKIEEMTEAGWEYRHASIYMQIQDSTKPSGYIRLTYDLTNQTEDSLGELRRWANQINLIFDTVKVVVRDDYFENSVGRTVNDD